MKNSKHSYATGNHDNTFEYLTNQMNNDSYSLEGNRKSLWN